MRILDSNTQKIFVLSIKAGSDDVWILNMSDLLELTDDGIPPQLLEWILQRLTYFGIDDDLRFVVLSATSNLNTLIETAPDSHIRIAYLKMTLDDAAPHSVRVTLQHNALLDARDVREKLQQAIRPILPCLRFDYLYTMDTGSTNVTLTGEAIALSPRNSMSFTEVVDPGKFHFWKLPALYDPKLIQKRIEKLRSRRDLGI